MLFSLNVDAQNNNATEMYYYQIPDYPEEYTATTVIARMVDGLGIRYYWATKGLRSEDLEFRASEEARTIEETIDHILGLTNIIINSVTHKPNVRKVADRNTLTFEEKRIKTLNNLKRSSEILKKSTVSDLETFNLVFQREDSSTEYPFWNQINGPISDALWHVGQVVSMRRTSGNPFDSKVSLFSGKVRD